jgi:hypothetical protein
LSRHSLQQTRRSEDTGSAVDGAGWCVSLSLDHFAVSLFIPPTSFPSLSDHDTADFLVTLLPRQWVETLESGNVTAANKIADALKQVDVGSPSLNLEERVAKALVSLGFSPQAT